MKSIQQLQRIASRLNGKGKVSLRDAWRALRYLPQSLTQIVSALSQLHQRLTTLEHSPHRPIGFPLNRALALSRPGKTLIVIPPLLRERPQIDFTDAKDTEILIGSPATVITHRDDFQLVIHWSEVSEAFRWANRYALESGRIAECLISNGKIQAHSFGLAIDPNHNSEESTPRLRSTCAHHWLYVRDSAPPHEAAFAYFERLRDLSTTFVDIGANTGISALSIHKVAPHWRIRSIEAFPILEPMLQQTQAHFENLGHDFQFQIIGLGSTASRQKLHVAVTAGEYADTLATFDPLHFSAAHVRPLLDSLAGGKWDERVETFEIDILPLDDLALLITTPHVVVKVDVEGIEDSVLNGMTSFIQKHRPAFVIECKAPLNTAAILARYGYDPIFYHYDPGQSSLVGGDSELSDGNYFFFPNDSPLFVPHKSP